MKYFLLLISILFLQVSFAKYPYVRKVEKNEIEWKASLDGIPVTIHLEIDKRSKQHQNHSFLKGWYWYDKYKIKIPLVGYDADVRGIYLAVFENDSICKSQRDTNETYYISEEVKFWQNVKGAKEKFEFFNPGVKEDGIWIWEGETANVKINEEGTIGFYNTEYLVFNETDSIDILKAKWLSGKAGGFEVYAFNPKTNSVVLHYNHRSTPDYVFGYCGGGYEAGFLQLKLSDYKSAKPLELKNFIYSSCLNYTSIGMIEKEELISTSNQIQIRKYYYSDDLRIPPLL